MYIYIYVCKYCYRRVIPPSNLIEFVQIRVFIVHTYYINIHYKMCKTNNNNGRELVITYNKQLDNLTALTAYR